MQASPAALLKFLNEQESRRQRNRSHSHNSIANSVIYSLFEARATNAKAKVPGTQPKNPRRGL
jgi:hypothetical protein